MNIKTLAAIALAAAAPLFAQASIQHAAFSSVAPTGSTAVEGPVVTALPFGSALSRRVMYAYDGSAVGYQAPLRITHVDLRADGATGGTSVNGTYNFSLRCSTGRLPANALDLTFANNHGADQITVFSGALAVPAVPVGAAPNPFSLHIPFSTPFEWDPRNGPLVLDFGYGVSAPTFGAFDAVTAPDQVGGLSASGSNSTLATAVLTAAPVIRLRLEGGVVPSAQATAEGGSSTAYPWGSSASTGRRVLTVYDAAAMPFTNRRWITALAWRIDQGGSFVGRTYPARITLSTSPVTGASLSTTFDANHGPDKVVVFDGTLAAQPSPANADLAHFDLTFELQRPFEYDPAIGGLAVDLQVFGYVPSAGLFDCVNQSVVQVGRVGHTSNANATTTAGSLTPSPQPGVGMVMAIRSVPVVVVPTSLANAVNTTLNTTNYPFGQPSYRSMSMVAAAAAGITQPTFVRHLRFRPTATAFGPTTWTCTIDLSNPTLTPATASSTFELNHGANRLRAFAGQFSCAYGARAQSDSGFPIEVKLQKPFLWDPTAHPHLTVDIVVSSRSGLGIGIETTNGLSVDDARITGNTTATIGSVQQLAAVMEIGGEAANGLAINEGSGCVGLNGVPMCSTAGLPSMPTQDFAVRVLQAAGNAPAFLVFGFAPAHAPLAGAPGCNLLHGLELGTYGITITDPGGAGSLAVPLPALPGADGFQFRAQWAVLDPSANALGVVTSNAVRLVARFF